jgi:hypothetical protein
MASSINASTSGAGGVITTADNTGILNIQTAGTTAVTVDASQNVGIGTTSPGYKVDVVGANGQGIRWTDTLNSVQNYLGSFNSAGLLGTLSNHPLAFYTNNAERMRIDSSGNVLVGKTTTSNSTAGILLGGLADLGYMALSRSQTTNTDVSLQVYSTGASANRFYVGMGGTVYATSTTITGISDQRVKENIVDLDDGLDAVMALKPRKFDWKEGKGKDIKGDRGFIAQEFETVFPDMIDEWKDPAPEGEEPYKAVNANLIPTLVKAIQEQQTIINDLKARVTALEAK